MRAGHALAVLMCCAAAVGRGQGGDVDTSAIPFSNPRFATQVIARIGPATITARQFLLSYEFGPAFAKRRKNSKHKYLEFMVNESLLALDAADRGGRAVTDVRRSVSEIENDLATEELYRDDVLSKVRVRDEELREAVAAQRIHCSLRWLFAPDREGIERYRHQLALGASFDSLYTRQMGDSVTPDLRSWEASRFALRSLRPTLAAVVDTLALHNVSAPLEGPDGWYMLLLDGITLDAITTDAEAIKQREDARRELLRQKADSLSDLYVDRLMRTHEPVIERRGFDLASAYLGQFWLRPEMRAALLRELTVEREVALAAIADPASYGVEPLVRMHDRSVTLEQFLGWYRAREFVLRLQATSVQAFQISLQQMVWRMVRDGLLIERAAQRGLRARESVKMQKAWWEEKVLYAYAKKRITDSIAIDERTAKAYYREHAASYRGPKGDTLSYDEAREQVRTDCYQAQCTARILHKLIALKRKYPVVIDEQALAALPVSEEGDPRSIDAYYAKKGGTFPHPAFPTIDYDWKEWQ